MTSPTGRGRGRPRKPRGSESHLGAELDRHLEISGITLTELANRCGVRADLPSRWRHFGTWNRPVGPTWSISPNTIGKIAAALDLDTADTQRLYMAAALDAGYQLQGYELPERSLGDEHLTERLRSIG